MRAARYHGRGDLRVEEVPAPVARPGELLVRVAVTGVCGTDAAELRHGAHLYWPKPEPHPASGHAGPLIPGHELAGVVEAVGAGVAGFREGDLVASGAGVSCGECRACLRGATNLCERYWTIGLQRDGGLAELVSVPAATCERVEPYGISADTAGLAQPMAIAAHAVSRGDPRPGDDVLVIGAGGIGSFITWAASRSGASSVVVVDPDPSRRTTALALGAAAAIQPAADGEALPTADLVLEVSGRADAFAAATRAVRPGGRIVVVGLHEPPTPVDLRALSLREAALVGTVAHRCAVDLPAALRLLAERTDGWADIAPVAIPLEDLVRDALDPLADGTATRIKTLVDPRITAPRPTVMAAAAPA